MGEDCSGARRRREGRCVQSRGRFRARGHSSRPLSLLSCRTDLGRKFFLVTALWRDFLAWSAWAMYTRRGIKQTPFLQVDDGLHYWRYPLLLFDLLSPPMIESH
jgi:hypothetical protein